jgi:hypothetical protein
MSYISENVKMDQNIFNYWYHMYTVSNGCHPPSFEHLQHYMYGHLKMPPIFIPLSYPIQLSNVQTFPQVAEPNNHIFNEKYGINTKDDCSNGMSCKDVYCKYFHHPCILQCIHAIAK